MKKRKRLKKIQDLILEYAYIDGEHHKIWLIDQIMRLATDDYAKFIKDDVDWDTGIAP